MLCISSILPPSLDNFKSTVFMKIDKLNIEIIRHLQDGRKSFKKIADELAVTENTVRSRVNKMEKEGILKISGLVPPDAVPGSTLVFVGVKLSNADLINMGEKFSKLRGVISTSVVTGRYDLIATVFLQEGFGLLEFYTEEVNHLEGIQSVESFVVYKGYNLHVPYPH